MLKASLAPELGPGTNRKGHRLGAAWSYLLPRRELTRVACLGMPSSASLETLAALSDELYVFPARRPRRRVGLGHLERTRIATPRPDGTLPLPDGGVDLVVVSDPSWARRLDADRGLHAELARVLAGDGRVWAWLPVARLGDGRRPSGLRFARPDQLLWLEVDEGEVRAAAPVADAEAVAYVSSLLDPAWRRSRAARALGRARPSHTRRRPPGQYGLLLHPANVDENVRRPPRYLIEAAAAAGVTISDHRWALLAAGSYRTKKVLVFLFPPGGTRPDAVVKLVRDERFNERLANEHRVLMQLHERGLVAPAIAPRPQFDGRHAGLAFLAQTAVEGTPFRQLTTGRPDCPHALAAVDWLVELAARSADPACAADVGAALRALLQRCEATYRLQPHHRDFLAAQIAMLAAHPAPFPLVFQHGDAGPWNLLVDGDGRLVVLDWEAADPQGMPLWDLLYFLRSYAVGAARGEGIRDAQRGFERHYLDGSVLGDLLADTADRYCARIGLARELVEPLFYTCWMHRCLKEAKSLSPRRLDRGRYITLLRRCVDGRGARGLRRLFAA